MNPKLFIFTLLFISCMNQVATESKHLKLINSFELDHELMEISGLDLVDDQTLAAIQDEKGIVYFIDKFKGSILHKIPFKKKGDFEGIALVNKDKIYAVNSAAEIFSIENDVSKKISDKIKDIEIEGLAYHTSKNKLLLVVKREKKKNKYIKALSFDLQKNKFDKKEFIKIKKNEDTKYFLPSAISIDQENNYYILSHASKQLLILDSEKNEKQLIELSNYNIFQPEGLAIDSDMKIYIASEGKKGITNPKIYVFELL